MRSPAVVHRAVKPFKPLLRRLEAEFNASRFDYFQKRNPGVVAVEICAGNGLFAQLNWCLYVFAHCARLGRRPHISLTGSNYCAKQGENWLDYFFEPMPGSQTIRAQPGPGIIRVHHIREIGLATKYSPNMTLDRAHALVQRYLVLKPELADYVASFAAENFPGDNVLGVHYRGTDKSAEATPVSVEHALQAVVSYLEENSDTQAVFVSSDESRFVEAAQRAALGVPIVVHDDAYRSSSGLPVHVTDRFDPVNRIKAREALVNCLLLARCRALIRTASFLSGWASVFNPELSVIMLNRPYQEALWFPDREVLRHESTRVFADRAAG